MQRYTTGCSDWIKSLDEMPEVSITQSIANLLNSLADVIAGRA